MKEVGSDVDAREARAPPFRSSFKASHIMQRSLGSDGLPSEA